MTIPSLIASEFSHLRFLIIDDFESFRLSMRQMLLSFGAANVEVAPQGNKAIQRCLYEHFDVVLCDYNLGSGKNGQHILEELRYRKLLRHTSLFLLVTAETSKDMVMGAREHQPDAYLTKPINRAMLEKRLGSLIVQRQALLPINRQIDLENYPEAISLCLQALSSLPKYKSWLMKTLADLYFRVGDYGHARKIYEDVLAQRDLSWARLGRGRVLVAEQHYDAAIVELETLIAGHPDFTEAYDCLAEALHRQGKHGQAQRTLELAVKLSPNALLRQKNLAQIAMKNQDVETAAIAWRATVRLGTHSVHDSGGHYLSLAQSLADLSEGPATEDTQRHSRESLSILAQMERRFSDVPELSTKALLVKARVYKGQGLNVEASTSLDQACVGLDNNTVGADLGLELAKTLFHLDKASQAHQLLTTLAQRFESDLDILKRIEALLDEPVGLIEKRQARQYTREGIDAFERGDLVLAADAFEHALVVVPAHTAVNLNLVQVRMKQLEQGSWDQQLYDQCQQRLTMLDQLPQQHRQYRRYIALRKKLDSLTHE